MPAGQLQAWKDQVKDKAMVLRIPCVEEHIRTFSIKLGSQEAETEIIEHLEYLVLSD